MSDHMQSVLVEGKLFIGGGHTGESGTNYVVMGYDFQTKKWDTLLPYSAEYFAMTVVNNMMVLVGGYTGGQYSNKLGVWRSDSKQWTHPYPDMPTARSVCSAVEYGQWLVIAGGYNGGILNTVEVLNYNSKQWYSLSPTPARWRMMKTAIVGNTCYFMGGYTGVECDDSTNKVYSLSIPALISQFDPGCQTASRQIWKEISPVQAICSTPLSISGSLLAVGGKDKDDKAVSTILLYQPDNGQWVKVGDLPTPRYNCTCIMLTDRELLVAGGFDGNNKMKLVNITSVQCKQS